MVSNDGMCYFEIVAQHKLNFLLRFDQLLATIYYHPLREYTHSQ